MLLQQQPTNCPSRSMASPLQCELSAAGMFNHELEAIGTLLSPWGCER
jgi:hypothetical protein